MVLKIGADQFNAFRKPSITTKLEVYGDSNFQADVKDFIKSNPNQFRTTESINYHQVDKTPVEYHKLKLNYNVLEENTSFDYTADQRFTDTQNGYVSVSASNDTITVSNDDYYNNHREQLQQKISTAFPNFSNHTAAATPETANFGTTQKLLGRAALVANLGGIHLPAASPGNIVEISAQGYRFRSVDSDGNVGQGGAWHGDLYQGLQFQQANNNAWLAYQSDIERYTLDVNRLIENYDVILTGPLF